MRSASVLIPTHNRVKLLERAIDSALAQTYPCEVVVVDGASNDGTLELCAGYGGKIQYYRFDRDPGFIESWYIAAALSSGQISHFCPDDDWMSPEFFEKTIPCLYDNVGMVLTQAKIHFDDGREESNLAQIRTGFYNSEDIEMQFMEMSMTLSPACWIARKKDVLAHLHSARLPYMPYRTPANEVYMTMSMFRDYQLIAIVDEPLAHFGAQDDASTMVALKKGGEHLEKFYNEYKWVKSSYQKLKHAYGNKYNHPNY